ncbi:MAG: N-6 DNA methylase, partial [Bacteroidales bacterium]|nr:N-6 DNA methylase [Bacteroidales bacterium]
SPDAFFCFANKPLILFFENPKNKDEVHKSVWNFNESPIVIIVDTNTIEIFNGFDILQDTKRLRKIGGEDKLDDFTYFELVTGKAWEKYNCDIDHDNRVDYKLLSNIQDTRKIILSKFQKPVTDTENVQNIKITNALLGKIIFVRYLIDREVKLNFDNNHKAWTNDDFCSLLKYQNKTERFFNYLSDPNQGFNGDLFPLTKAEYAQIPKEAYEVLIRLLKSEDIATGQRSLFDLYDFSIIPIEFISNIYESFVGKENQAKNGVYYTPLFLVDYILSETVKKHTDNSSTVDCKVLDPACGSGVFLVETLRILIECYIKDTPNYRENIEKFKEDINKIVEKNIFGIDSDESAVEVAIFSVYLTLLDYMYPPEIASFKFPKLLNTNFFHSDFFNTNAGFNSKLKNVDFSFIIGNPPWKRGKNESEKPLYVTYIENRRKEEKNHGGPIIEIGNKEIAQAFLLRVSDFSMKDTKCALIITSKVLYNLQSANFRQYFLHNFIIKQVFELAPVRREVFNKSIVAAVAPACVLFFQYANGQETNTNIVKHIALKPSRFFSLFKIFVILRNDIQNVQQNRLKEFDWLWKVLVYGSYLDFNFIKRLKDDFITINDSFDKDTLVKQGIKRVDGNNKINTTKLLGWDSLDLRKEIKQFHITSSHSKWDLEEVGYIYRENDEICEDIFSPPMLLIKETVNTELESVAAISSKKILFTDKVTSIKFRDKRSIDDYYLLASLMNSTLFAYYVLNISSTAGIMIEQQINDIERFAFPYTYSDEIIREAKKLESLKKELFSAIIDDRQALVEQAKENINQFINKAFGLDNIEQTLVDYSRNIIIPISMKHKGYEKVFLPCSLEDPILVDYVRLFLDRFKSKFDTVEKRFVVEIWHTEQIIGMFFKIISEAEYKQDIIWINKQNDKTGIFATIIKLNTDRITDKLFIQKDVRGFEKEYFYIFKPNEKRLWHKAIGYLDVNEFSDAILKAGGSYSG